MRMRTFATIGLAGALLTAVTACSPASSSSGAGSGGDGLPKDIKLKVISELSGPAGVAGLEIKRGYDLAVKDINSRKVVGDSTLSLSYSDTAGKPATGASLASSAVTGGFPIVFGSPVGADALAEAPIFAKAKQPTIFNEAGADGVLAGKYIFRMTPTIPSYYSTLLKYLQSQNIKTLSVITNSDQPTLTQMAKEAQQDAATYGYKVVSYDSVISTQTDVSATVTKVAQAHADAVAVLVQTGQNATFVKGLAEAGYKGLVTSSTSAGGGVLAGAGAAANGVVWATDYASQQGGPSNAEFVKAFQAAYGHEPTNWAAAAYDSMHFAALSLQKAGSTDRDKLQQAMTEIGEQGFDGVLGSVHVKDGQQTPVSTLVKWENGEAVPVAAG